MIRVLVVDDERLARQKVRLLIARHADLEVVGECADGETALLAIRAKDPDLVFLDVRMPGLSGLDLWRALKGRRVPAVVFVTAHAGHALEAFEVEAVDYLLKPFDRRRFDRALERARRRLQQPPESRRRSLEEALSRIGRLVFHLDKKTVVLAADEVDWIGAEDKYVRVHARGARHLVRENLRTVEKRLDPAQFFRIHRGVIVNARRVREVHRGVGDDHVVVLEDGTRLPMSRRHRARLRAQGVEW